LKIYNKTKSNNLKFFYGRFSDFYGHNPTTRLKIIGVSIK